MSEQGSFITEYIHCPQCFESVKPILLARRKHLCSEVILSWTEEGEELPIIAGKIGGMYPQEEIHDFENGIILELEKVICHPMRIAVLAEEGESILLALPQAEHFEYLKRWGLKKVSHNQWLERKLRIKKDQLEAAATRILRLESQLTRRVPEVPFLVDRIAELEGVIRDLLAKNYGGNPEIAKDFSFTVDLLASAKDEDEYREAMSRIKDEFDGKLPSFWQDAMKEAARKVQNSKT